MDKQLTSPVPEHNHEVQNSELTVYKAKQNLKRKAADGDQPTKYLASEAVSGMGLEARAKVGCQLSSLNRMVQKSYCLRSGDNQQIQRIIDNYDEYTSILDFLRAVGCLSIV